MITKDRRVSGLAICLILYGSQLFAEISMPSIFGDHMVIQQNSVVPFWGRADPGERIRIRASWLTADTSILPDDRGEWMVRLNSPGAGGPFEIAFSGTNEILLKDILAGEVWLASGQSNMAMALNRCDNAESEIASATYPGIRLFHIERISATEPMSDCRGSWKGCQSLSGNWCCHPEEGPSSFLLRIPPSTVFTRSALILSRDPESRY